jgi:hypothetical protein
MWCTFKVDRKIVLFEIERLAVRSNIDVNLLSTFSGPMKLFGIPAVFSGGLGFESGIGDQLSGVTHLSPSSGSL